MSKMSELNIAIMDAIESGKVSFPKMAEQFGVSPDTIEFIYEEYIGFCRDVAGEVMLDDEFVTEDYDE